MAGDEGPFQLAFPRKDVIPGVRSHNTIDSFGLQSKSSQRRGTKAEQLVTLVSLETPLEGIGSKSQLTGTPDSNSTTDKSTGKWGRRGGAQEEALHQHTSCMKSLAFSCTASRLQPLHGFRPQLWYLLATVPSGNFSNPSEQGLSPYSTTKTQRG